MSDGASSAVVIGCDSMLSIDGALVGKPHTPEVAAERWRAMRGRTGRLLTGHCAVLIADGAVSSAVSGTPLGNMPASHFTAGSTPLDVSNNN